MQIISCKQAGTDLPDCQKKFGGWELDGNCIATGSIPECGPGTQRLKRTCTNGTGSSLCAITDIKKNATCSEVGTQYKNCPKTYGPWVNIESCVADNKKKTCGPGVQKQIRICN